MDKATSSNLRLKAIRALEVNLIREKKDGAWTTIEGTRYQLNNTAQRKAPMTLEKVDSVSQLISLAADKTLDLKERSAQPL